MLEMMVVKKQRDEIKIRTDGTNITREGLLN